jgi:Peptidase family M48
MRRNFITFSLLAISLIAFGQNVELKSDHQREMESFSDKFEESYNHALEESYNESRDVRIAALRSSATGVLFESMLLKGGGTVFNSTADALVKSIGNHIISTNKDAIQGKMEFYVMRSSAVNAFATDNGNIWITTGLLSKIETEAQLAFIMSHEISHFLKQHNLENTKNQAKVANKQGSFQYLEVSAQEAVIHGFSQTIETEADEVGYGLYSNAGYNTSAIPTVFDLLTKCILPSSMDKPALLFPYSSLSLGDTAEYSLPSFSQSDIEQDEEDVTTHPSIYDRRESIKVLEASNDSKGSKDFITVTKEELQVVVQSAEYSLGFYYLRDLNFYMSLSHNQMLIKKYPDDSHIKSNILKSWYGLFLYKSSDVDQDLFPYYTQYGETSVYKDVVNDLSKKYLVAHVVAGAFALYQLDTNNKEYKEILMMSLEAIDDHISAKHRTKSEMLARLSLDESEEIYKYIDKIDDDLLIRMLREMRFINRMQVRANFNLKEDGVIFLNPFALRVDETTFMSINIKESERLNQELEEHLSYLADYYGIRHTIVGSNEALKSKPDAIDDIYTSGLLLRQHFLTNEENEPSSFNLLVPPDKLEALKTKYNSRYVAYAGAFYTKNKVRPMVALGKAYLMVQTPMLLPGVLSGHGHYRNKLEVYILIYDLESNQFVYRKMTRYKRCNMKKETHRLMIQNEIYQLIESTL